MLATRSTEDKMVCTNPCAVSYFREILTIYQFKPQFSPFWRTEVPYKFFNMIFYNKPMNIKRIKSQLKSNPEI